MNLPVVDVAVVDLRSGNDLFYCAPYNCKLMAKKCVERQAKVAAGIGKSDYAWCVGCALGALVKDKVGEGEPLPELEHKVRANAPAFQRRATKPKVTAEVSAPKEMPVLEEKTVTPKLPIPEERQAQAHPLTRKILEDGLAIYLKFKNKPDLSDRELFDYTEFFGDYGLDLIMLSMAALGRLDPTPARADKPYAPNKLSPKHQTVLDTIAANPGLTRSDIADLVGVAYHRLKLVFPFLEQCGMIVRKNDPIKAADVWHVVEKT